jgi:putative ATPase
VSSLFDEPQDAQAAGGAAPLAERMRPRTLDEVVGHAAAIGEGTALRRLVDADRLPSLLLWGPPGCGKTSIAMALAGSTDAVFETLSAVLAGVKDVRAVVARAEDRLRRGRRTLLFVDEIHRFNKAQQDAFLPHVERGTVVLVGATTENPSFHVIAPLLSRARVVVLEPLSDDALEGLARRALDEPERGLGARDMRLGDDALRALVAASAGDARALLNVLEAAASSLPDGAEIGRDDVAEAAGRAVLRHDRAGDAHFALASALQKSIRAGDVQAGLYWCARLLVAGEDPLFVARRLVVIASEDVGIARPSVLPIVIAARDAAQFLGMPECAYALLEAVTVLASAPRSNAVAAAWKELQAEIAASGALPVPDHLRPGSTRLAKEMGWGAGYRYAHDYEGGMSGQVNLPPELAEREWLRPGDAGFEVEVARYLEELREFRRSGEAVRKGEREDVT